MDTLKVALIGTGYFSQFHYAAWKRMPDVQIVGLLTLDEQQGKEFQTTFDVPQLYPDLQALLEGDADLIDIVSPPPTHAAFVRQVIEHDIRQNSKQDSEQSSKQADKRNRAIVCQKPFCNSIKEATDTVQFIEQHNAFVAIHENFRFQPWYKEIKTLLDAGQLGQLYEIQFNFRPGDGQGPDAYLARQPYFQKQPRFFIQETGVHFIDVFRYLIGDVNGLFARLNKLNPVIAGEDAGVVVFEFDKGVRGVLNGNRLSDHNANNTRLTMGEMCIEGSDATLYLNGNGSIQIRQQGSDELVEHDYSWQNIDFGGDCVYRTNRHIADNLLSGAPVQNLAKDYLRNRIIEDTIYQSNERGQWMAI